MLILPLLIRLLSRKARLTAGTVLAFFM